MEYVGAVEGETVRPAEGVYVTVVDGFDVEGL